MGAADDQPQFVTLCRLEDIEDGGAKGVEVSGDTKKVGIILLRSGDKVHGFLNRCPHRGLPLETFPDAFLDETGETLICTNHGARFRASDGMCIQGPCINIALVRMPLALDNGAVVLAAPPHIVIDMFA